MRFPRNVLLVASLATLAACGKDEAPRLDDALRNDLSLATSAQPYQPQQFVSPQEMGYAYGQQPGYYPQAYGQQPYYQPQPVVYQPAPQPRVIRRAPASAQGAVYRTEPRVIRNTKRDAVIGAAAGAAIGAVASKNRVKGAVIGAAAGGILGGIIGHTVDVKRIP